MMNNQKTAFVFPGQGSQSVGMLSDLACQYDEIKQTFEEASIALGYDLWQMTQLGPALELDKTVHTQPALLAASYALWRVMTVRHPVKPPLLAGHSLGEYTALVCAGALRFEEAIKLVAARGQYMQEAVQPGEGAMAAIIGLDDAAVADICQQIAISDQQVISPANFNSIGQVVIAGHAASVQRAVLIAKEQGAKLAVILPVSVPSHCALMRPAALRLQQLLETTSMTMPTIPVISNVDVQCYESVSAIREGLVRQMYLPVRWVETIQAFTQAGITHIVECGPGKVLTGLNKRIDKTLSLLSAGDYINAECIGDNS